jgi:Family of unknown function (DUF6445)
VGTGELKYLVHLVGRDKEPVIILDNFVNNAASVVQYAVQSSRFVQRESGLYPGIRSDVPESYLLNVLAVADTLVKAVYGLEGPLRPFRDLCALSIVTQQPSTLTWAQKIPHSDMLGRCEVSVVHYLCDETHGGTSFYRHRQTGWESLNESREAEFFRAVQAEVAGLDRADGYVNGNNAFFERTFAVPAKMNRAIVFRSCLLHSADIEPGSQLSCNPAVGRLTGTLFFSAGPFAELPSSL